MSSTSTSSTEIFGALISLPVYEGSFGIIIVICSVVTLQYATHLLHALAVDTAFSEMLAIIERELMIVGFMSFVIKTVESSQPIDSTWYLALEFADTFVPITAFIFCFQGTVPAFILPILLAFNQLFLGGLFILVTTVLTSLWSKGYQLHIFEILSEFYAGYRDHMDK